MTPSDDPCAGHELPLLEFAGLSKVFPNGTIALAGVDLQVQQGSVHGLVGANGAGKSTLIKILAGAQQATAGSMYWRGEAQSWTHPGDAYRAGIATIHQDVPLAPTLSVLENIFIRSAGLKRRDPTEKAIFADLLERVGYSLQPDTLVGGLPIGKRQMVAIFQALAAGADLIVMDEPTASLADSEREAVFDTINRLKESGTTFIYVSHFLDEVLELTDTITVLRDGAVVAARPTAEFDEEGLIEAIVGSQPVNHSGASSNPDSRLTRTVLELDNVSSPTGIQDISFSVAAGEIVGLAGLLGSGRSEVLHAIYRSDRQATGKIRLNGEVMTGRTSAAVKAGVGLVPEDRNTQGLLLEKSLRDNIVLPALDQLTLGKWFADQTQEEQRARRGIDLLGIVSAGPDAPARSLSGGNAQKVLFARWILASTKLLLLDEPTAGVDVGAKAEIAEQIRAFAADGGAVVIVDSEFEELLRVAHRVLVLKAGKIIAETDANDTSEHELLVLASGLGQRETV